MHAAGASASTVEPLCHKWNGKIRAQSLVLVTRLFTSPSPLFFPPSSQAALLTKDPVKKVISDHVIKVYSGCKLRSRDEPAGGSNARLHFAQRWFDVPLPFRTAIHTSPPHKHTRHSRKSRPPLPPSLTGSTPNRPMPSTALPATFRPTRPAPAKCAGWATGARAASSPRPGASR